MSTIVTRAGKGSPLTNNEVDANFTNLNTDKLESADLSGYAELTGATFTGDVEGTEFIGSLRGNNIFKAQAGEALSKGDAIYISGISGNTPIVSLADADNAAKMPAFGVAADDATLNSAVDVVTYGAITNVDTSGFTLGDTLYVGTTTGQLVNTPPTGESSLIQNLGKVERVHALVGILFIAGAGRTNATPNLDDGNFFLGNGSNQSVSADFETSVTGIALPLTGGTLTGDLNFGDNDKAIFGAGSDLQIYHDGSNNSSYIKETGTGSFNIEATNLFLKREGGTESFIDCVTNGAVTAYYDGSAKLATTATGIDVTGTATMDGLTVDGNTGIVVRNDASGSTEPKIVFDNDLFAGANHAKLQTGNGGLQLLIESPSTSSFQNRHQILMNGGGNDDVVFKLSNDNGATYKNQLKIESCDLSLFEDTGTTPKFFWDASAESLGIGTSSPSKTLTVEGTGLRVQSTASADFYSIAQDALIVNNGTANLRLWNNGSERMRIDSSGNVGIGTTSPVSPLHIQGDDNVAVRIKATGANSLSRLLLQNDGRTWTIDNDGANADALTFYDATAVAERMRIDSSGNVGIGTDSPARDLVVKGSIPHVSILANTNTQDCFLDFGDEDDDNKGRIVYANSDDSLAFYSNAAERMRIDASGNLGIGTSSPNDKFHVANGSTGAGYLRIANNEGYARLGTDGGNLLLDVGGSEAMRIDSSGNVGIGTSSPSSALDVAGNVALTGTVDGRDVATDGTKLDTIETNADVTDTANVTAAGALMDSEVTNLAQVKAFDSADYATAAQGTTADAALPKAGGTMTGEIAMGTSKITGLGDPTAAQDAATKAYVDAGGGGGGETLQETLAIGNTVATDTKIQFRDTGLYINSSADGQLDIVADTEVQLGATTFDINAAVVTSGDVTVGHDLKLLSDSSRLNFGLDNDVNLTHVHNAGLLLNSTRRLYFNGTNNSIYAPSTTTLDINASSEIELNATLIDVNGSLDVSGNITVAGGIIEDSVTLSGTTVNIFQTSGTNFVHSLIGNTTYNFANPPSAGNAGGFTLKIVQNSTPRTITWPASVDWAGGIAPTLTTTSGGVDIFVFYTPDGGSTYYGFTAGQAMA